MNALEFTGWAAPALNLYESLLICFIIFIIIRRIFYFILSKYVFSFLKARKLHSSVPNLQIEVLAYRLKPATYKFTAAQFMSQPGFTLVPSAVVRRGDVQ